MDSNQKTPPAFNPAGGVDLSGLGKDPDKRSKLEKQLTRYLQMNDENIDNIMFTIELIWEHIAAISRKLGIDAEAMAKMVMEREENQRWLTASSEEEVKLRDIKNMFNAKQPSKTESDQGQEAKEEAAGQESEPIPGNDTPRQVEGSAGDTAEAQAPGDSTDESDKKEGGV